MIMNQLTRFFQRLGPEVLSTVNDEIVAFLGGIAPLPNARLLAVGTVRRPYDTRCR